MSMSFEQTPAGLAITLLQQPGSIQSKFSTHHTNTSTDLPTIDLLYGGCMIISSPGALLCPGGSDVDES